MYSKTLALRDSLVFVKIQMFAWQHNFQNIKIDVSLISFRINFVKFMLG